MKATKIILIGIGICFLLAGVGGTETAEPLYFLKDILPDQNWDAFTRESGYNIRGWKAIWVYSVTVPITDFGPIRVFNIIINDPETPQGTDGLLTFIDYGQERRFLFIVSVLENERWKRIYHRPFAPAP